MVIGLLIGMAAGLLSGLFGIGGGIIIVPSLVLFEKFTQSKAVGTSLGAMLLPVGILAVWKYAKQGDVNFRISAMVGIGLFIMAFFGAKMGISLGDKWLMRAFGILQLLLGVKFLFFSK
jgi:uncharacterized membrane protein YfcA